MSEAKKHWRTEIDSNSEVFTSADLFEIGGGADVTFRIDSTGGGTLKNPELGKAKRTIMVKLAGVVKPWGLNITNAKSLEKLTGSPFRQDWTGALVTLYVTTTKRQGEECDCIRVRPRKPTGKEAVHGLAGDPVTPPTEQPFDLDGWRASFADVETQADLTALRAKLNATKRPKESREPLAAAIAAAEKRIAEAAL